MADVSKVKLNGTAYNVKDASVPSWAKQSSKPSYTQDEVGDGSTYKRVTSTEKSTWNNKGTYSKPSGGIPKSDLASAVQTSLGKADTALQSFTESDPTVPSWAKASSKPSYTASEVGAIATSAKGAANGVASLDSSGKVPSSQLPSYVDDVLEYSAKSSFPSTGETGKIYVDTSTNKTYRWSGSAYVEISASLALGETSSTAYRGDRGKTAYNHATDSSRLTTATASGLYKVASTAQGHIASLTAVVKSDITGLGIPAQDTTYGVVSTSANGLAPKVTDTSKFLKGDGTWATPANTWTAMVGATSSANGSVGYVNAVPPKDGYNTKYLRADGSWQVPPNTTYSAATQLAAGLMSSTDKTKLDGIASGAQVNSITGVKGNSESSYRTGNVNLTAANIGAAASSHTHNYAGSSSAGGAANNVVIPRVTKNCNDTLPGTNKVKFEEFSNNSTNTPTSEWYHVITMEGQDGNYATQLALGMTTNRIFYRNYNVSTWTAWKELTSNTGTVTGVKVGSTSYSPSSGVVSLPAYPTTLPASDVSSWAKASTKPTYNQDEVGDGTTYKRVTSTEKTTWNNKGTYSKPSGGIPKTDLASAVQTSLGKADTALQSFSTKGADLQLGTASSSSDDSGDIVFYYGNGNEKARIWMNDTYAAADGPHFRISNSSGSVLYTGNLVLGDGTGLSTVSQNIANNTLYARRSGKTVTVNGFVDNLSLTAGNSTLLGTINNEIGKPQQQVRAVCNVGPNAYSFGEPGYIAIASDGNVVVTPKTYSGTGAVFFSVSYTI